MDENEPTPAVSEQEVDAEDANTPAFLTDQGQDVEVMADLDESDEDEGQMDQDGDSDEDIGEDTAGGEEVDYTPDSDDAVLVLNGHSDAVLSLAASPVNPSIFASGGMDDKAILWSVEEAADGSKLGYREHYLTGHTDTVGCLGFSCDGALLATGGLDGRVNIWDTATGALKVGLEGPGEGVESIAWHPKGPVVLGGSEDFSVWMWNANSGACMQVFTGHSASVTSVMFTPDGRQVITASADASVRVWEPKSGGCVATVQGHPFSEGGVTCMRINNEGTMLITGSEDSKACIIALQQATAKVVGKLEGHSDSVESVDICQHMPLLAATASMDTLANIWDMGQHQIRVSCKHPEGVTKVKFHPSLPLLLTACLDFRSRVWDIRSGNCERIVQGHAAGVQDLVPTCDGQRFISGADDYTVRLFMIPV